MSTPHVVIVGGGFGGLRAAQTLRHAAVRITLIDRTNHHLFQPLLYQVAMAGLSPADIAAPIRSVLRRQANTTVILAEVTKVDLAASSVTTTEDTFTYDYLILATGGRTTYFGHNDWEKFAPGLKDLDDAIEIRRRVLLAFEAAEKEQNPDRRRDLLTFVIVGGGPTGVELAGAVAELSRFVLARDFRTIDSRAAAILLLEGGPRILTTFPPDLSASAVRQLEELGVKVRVNAKVTNITQEGVSLGDEQIRSATVIWGAGIEMTALMKTLGVPLDRMGRIEVEPDLTIPGFHRAFAVGDIASFKYQIGQAGQPLPGVSPVAMQMGAHAARNIRRELAGKDYKPFKYFDKGNMATIGRSRAIAAIGKVHLSGFMAWLAWLGVHIFFLIGFRNRIVVLLEWAWSYVTYQRGARLITGRRLSLTPAASAATSQSSQGPIKPGEYQMH
jgi:NADH:quinone reductase (non-electrogenic)